MENVETRGAGNHTDNKERLQKIFPYILLGAACIFFCYFFVLQYGVFGSKTDWINQHSVLPDYFRKHFYNTGRFFPNFAWNIGGGQNIYHLSYYGLFSPVILLSFFLPFIRMDYYIMGSSILCYILSVLIFYRFMERKKLSQGVCIGTALFFALATPLIYHSYNQLMFVNYMPFLCLALLGTDDYLSEKRKGCLFSGVLGMLFTSFYFSIGGLIALCLYALSEYLLEHRDAEDSSVFNEGKRYVGILLHGVLLSCILLVPTAVSIFSSRQENTSKEQITQFIAFEPLKVLYTPYGMGLSVLAIVAVLGGVICVSEWQERVLPTGLITILGVPAIGFLLNGGLYDKEKVFIPFIPLVCLQCGRYVAGKLRFWIFPWIFTGMMLYAVKDVSGFKKYFEFAWLDFGITFLCFLLYVLLADIIPAAVREKKLQKWINVQKLESAGCVLAPLVLFSSCLVLFGFQAVMHPERDRMISTKEYQAVADTEKQEQIQKVLEEDKAFYRFEEIGDGTANLNNMNRIADIRQNITSMYSSCFNKEYWNFRNQTFQLNEPFRNNMMQSVTDNPCFLQLMGVKYLLTDKKVAGYESMKTDKLLQNASAAPVFYVTNQIIGEEQYMQYSFPENQTALLQSAVVPQEEIEAETEVKQDLSRMSVCDFELPEYSTPELTITKTSDGYHIVAEEEVEVFAEQTGKLPKEKDDLFALMFDVENKKPDSDMYIRVNDQTNRLTAVSHEYANHNTNFTFMVTRDTKEGVIKVKLGAGDYQIQNIEAYSGRWEELQDDGLYQGKVTLDSQQNENDWLLGEVDISEGGYLITSIPYDKNFRIWLDDREIECMKVNTAFLGAKLPSGKHEIIITYAPPGKKAGCLLSAAGLFVCLAQAVIRKEKEEEEKKRLF